MTKFEGDSVAARKKAKGYSSKDRQRVSSGERPQAATGGPCCGGSPACIPAACRPVPIC